MEHSNTGRVRDLLKYTHAAASHSVRLGFRSVRQAYGTYIQKPEAMQSVWLHGVLHVTIHEADDLLNPDRKTGMAPKLLRKLIEKTEDLLGDGKDSSNCYVAVDLPPTRVARTSVLHNTTHPKWNETFRILCAHEVPELRLEVKDNKVVGAATLGMVYVLASDLVSGQELHNWFPLFDDLRNPIKGKLRASLQFTAATQEPLYRFGAGMGDGSEVPFTYYHLQRVCRVTLYQDAHIHKDFQPHILLSNGQVYQPPRCWEDMYAAIASAQHFVYMAGWSVFDKTVLVHDSDHPKFPGSKGTTLGELLKRKAEEGVRVLLLVWDDKTSVNHQILGDVTKGLMSTHDEDTYTYFKGTKVECILCPRTAEKGLSAAQSVAIGTMFTHHQKTLVADAAAIGQPLDSPDRRIIAFLGGIDLCHGRYDTQQHSIFATLNTIHREDFYQTCFDKAELSKGGPRQPWHDIHCKVEGPVSWDVLHNFEQRWRKQALEVKKGAEHCLLPLASIRGIQPPHLEIAVSEGDSEMWMSQVLRSIGQGSVDDFPDDPEKAFISGLSMSRGTVFDRSMQDGWIHAIRRAQHFLYIESQYFLGGCSAWKSSTDSGCLNLIPLEIALKIVAKIQSGEPFAAYILIPMYPEGSPSSMAVQAILFWQWKTMEMMYSMIAAALKDMKRDDEKPTDYLRFFCLGNREAPTPDELIPSKPVDANTYYGRAQKNRRFMIYVHSKMLIVDDEFVIVGSANVNQRSMDGGRDTEIAAGSFQPAHTWAVYGGPPRGQVHGFRMSLWAEHTGTLSEEFLEPWTVSCMRLVGDMGAKNWDTFTGTNPVNMAGHLMTYPVTIDTDGGVAPLSGFESFPDAEKATVLGTKSSVIPDILTT